MNTTVMQKIIGFALMVVSTTVWAVCYEEVTRSCYQGNLGDPCDATSPNCITPDQGSVTSLGERTIVQDAGTNSVGKVETRRIGNYCEYYCTIANDCEDVSITVAISGNHGSVEIKGANCQGGSGTN